MYLTPEQRQALFLEIRISIASYEAPISFSNTRNPQQTVWGWATLVYQESVTAEVAVRFDYQTIYRDFDSYKLLSQALCIYYKQETENLKTLTNLLPGGLLVQYPEIQGLSVSLNRGIDSVRFVSLAKTNFTVDVFWEPDLLEGPCQSVPVEVVDPAPQPSPSPSPEGENSSPGSSPVANGGLPVGSLSGIPEGAFAGDYGDRNLPSTPLFWAYRYVFRAPSFGCSDRTGLAFGNPRTPVTQPNPYTLGPPQTQQPADDCAGVRRVGFFRDGVYLGDIFGVIGEPTLVQVPETER